MLPETNRENAPNQNSADMLLPSFLDNRLENLSISVPEVIYFDCQFVSGCASLMSAEVVRVENDFVTEDPFWQQINRTWIEDSVPWNDDDMDTYPSEEAQCQLKRGRFVFPRTFITNSCSQLAPQNMSNILLKS